MRRIALLGIALVIGACGQPDLTVIPTSELPLDVYGDAAAEPAQQFGAEEPFGAATPNPAGELPETGTVYMIKNRLLVPVDVDLPAAASLPEALLRGLLDAEPEKSGTAIPSETRLIKVTVSNGVATVDLSEEFEQGGPGQRLALRVAQVVYTLTEAPQVISVLFSVEGRPRAVIAGEDLVVDRPVTRADYERYKPAE